MRCDYHEGFVTEGGETLCFKCLRRKAKREWRWKPKEIEEYLAESATPIFADSEWESYPSCADCGHVFDYVNRITMEEPT